MLVAEMTPFYCVHGCTKFDRIYNVNNPQKLQIQCIIRQLHTNEAIMSAQRLVSTGSINAKNWAGHFKILNEIKDAQTVRSVSDAMPRIYQFEHPFNTVLREWVEWNKEPLLVKQGVLVRYAKMVEQELESTLKALKSWACESN